MGLLGLPPGVRFAVVIAAAGSGQRFGNQASEQVSPQVIDQAGEHAESQLTARAGERITSQSLAQAGKQLALLQGRPVLEHTLDIFAGTDEVSQVLLVCPPQQEQHYAALFRERSATLPLRILPGGPTRAESVYLALQAAAEHGPLPELIAVHDAARPLATPELLRRCCLAALEYGAAVPGLSPIETVKQVRPTDGLVLQTLPRADLRLIQTPQVFRSHLLRDAYHTAAERGILPQLTDDAGVVEANAGTVYVVPGEPWNLKITVPLDLELAEFWLQRRAPTC